MNWKTFFLIFWMIIAIITFSLLGSFVHRAATEEGYTMELIANDIAFGLTNALHVKGDVDIIYNIDKKFDVEVENGIVTVKYDKYTVQANYIQNNQYKIERERRKDLVKFTKRDAK